MVVSTRHGRLLRQLLPPGQLFTTDPDSNLQRLLNGLGGELEAVERTAEQVPEQLDPSIGSWSIADWERVLGLPDDCGPAPESLEERRRAILGRLLAGGDLARPTYLALAQALGYTVAIQEGTAQPFRCGSSRCGERLGTFAGVFEWTVIVLGGSTRRFRAGAGACGDPLSITSDELLECVIRRAAPAHTGVRFRYEADAGICWVVILDEGGAPIQVLCIDGRFFVIDELGNLIELDTSGGVIQVLDEDGNPIGIPVQES